MNILVVGGHFFNKGAQLMLQTVFEEFKNRSNHTLYLSPCSGTTNQIASIGYKTIDFPLKHVTDYRGFKIFFRFGGIIKFLRKQYRGEIPFNKIDAVVDISGFAYSDQWGEKAVSNVLKLIRFFRKRHVNYYFLPQAFGPFTEQSMRTKMTSVIKECSYIAARDDESKKMLLELYNENKVKQFPDITISLKGISPKEVKLENYICVVPNERMLDQGREYWLEGEYFQHLIISVNKILNKSACNIKVVIHDKGQGDTRLAKDLVKEFEDNERVELLMEENPLTLKAILGQAQLVVGSRYHALVSSLSQNVPCIALGWSHKYKMLFDEYQISDLSFDKPNAKVFEKALIDMLEDKKREQICVNLSQRNLLMKQKNNEMWSEILTSLSESEK